jgi:NADPH-dependent 2,4-dienoyl-CoA reductase/sulfur reductase-like enzyme
VHVAIVGASLAGLTTAEALRDEGFTGRITLIGGESHVPYSRPMLSKQVLADERDDARIRDDAELARLDIELLLGAKATALDRARREVHLSATTLHYDELVIATGATARRPVLAGVRTLRTIDDALELRGAFAGAERVAIIGAGILACELASAARSADLEVTLLARRDSLSLGALGTRMSGRIAALLSANGVRVQTCAVVASADAAGVTLDSGIRVPADVVVAAIGCEPAVEWLSGSGLDLSDGVVCDENGRAGDNIHAVGDVAAWVDASTGLPTRVEHQQNAIEQAQAVARRLVTGAASDAITPFFWTTLFGTRILVHGRIGPDVELETVAGDADGDRFVIAARRGGRTEGLVGWNMPREFRIARSASTPPERTLA